MTLLIKFYREILYGYGYGLEIKMDTIRKFFRMYSENTQSDNYENKSLCKNFGCNEKSKNNCDPNFSSNDSAKNSAKNSTEYNSTGENLEALAVNPDIIPQQQSLDNVLSAFDRKSFDKDAAYADLPLPDYNSLFNEGNTYSGTDEKGEDIAYKSHTTDGTAPHNNMHEEAKEIVKEPIKYPISPESVGKGVAIGYFLANIFGKTKAQKALIFGSTAIGAVAVEEYTKRKGIIK